LNKSLKDKLSYKTIVIKMISKAFWWTKARFYNIEIFKKNLEKHNNSYEF